MAETEIHARDMMDLIESLRDHFAADPEVYCWGNLLLFYERGNKRKHVAPDVFVVRGVPKEPPRKNYLLWEEGKGPDVVIELTSKTTRAVDQKKFALYRDDLQVPEYFLFDPFEDYLQPPMQGYRLVEGQYVAIEPVEGRLPSAALGLPLERQGRGTPPVRPRDRPEVAHASRASGASPDGKRTAPPGVGGPPPTPRPRKLIEKDKAQ